MVKLQTQQDQVVKELSNSNGNGGWKGVEEIGKERRLAGYIQNLYNKK